MEKDFITDKFNSVDFELSPYTGMTRQSWKEAAEHILSGIFQYIHSSDDALVIPRQETEKTYPHKESFGAKLIAEQKAEKFEGLTRTMFIAAPLIRDNPQISICGIELKDYYKKLILRSCSKEDPLYVGDYESLQEASNYENPLKCYQQTVEIGALVICLWITKNAIWDTYTTDEKDKIAAVISSFAYATTEANNWHLFNMLGLAFLNMEGYPIQKDVMLGHAQAILDYYVGDGWYRDGHFFDYYSCWAFNLYAPIWNLWYGYEHEPYLAKKFEERSNKLMETYADFFDRDGFVQAWGRSGIYRNATTSVFVGNMLLQNSKGDPGLARRISSGALLQFLRREDFLYNGVPTLGLYGQFAPLVQPYSCVMSPFWFGKAFLCLLLPEGHPFWTAKEHNGTWERLKDQEVKVTTLDGPALCFSNHQANGETILRTGKVSKRNWSSAYSRLSFNTKFPWEDVPTVMGESILPQQYSLIDESLHTKERINVILWHGEKEEVLYRKGYFNFTTEKSMHLLHAIYLADFTVPYGIVRVDKMFPWKRPFTFTLGSYGFPDNGTQIIEKTSGTAKAIILKGKDYTGQEKQMAMTIYDGWDTIGYVHSKGTNADSANSIIIYAKAEKKKQYGGFEPYILISQVITKECSEEFSEDEIFPIKEICYIDSGQCGCYGPITLQMKDGSKKVINYESVEGQLTL